MCEAGFGHDTAAWGASEEAELDEIGFIDIFDRLHFLASDGSQGLDTSWTAFEFGDEGMEDVTVGWLEAEVVDFVEVERFPGEGARDRVNIFDFRIVAHSFQNAVGHTRGLATAPGDLRGTVCVEADTQDIGGAFDDLFDVRGGIKFQTMGRAETVAQGIGQRTEASGGADQGETGQIELDGPGRRPFANDDIELVVFHSRVEYFLDHFIEAMNFVDEEDIARLEVGQNRAEVAHFFDGWSRGDLDTDTHFFGDDMSEGRLAQTGWPIEENVLDRFTPFLGRLNKYVEVALDFILTDVFVKRLRSQRVLDGVFFFSQRTGERRDGGGALGMDHKGKRETCLLPFQYIIALEAEQLWPREWFGKKWI